MKLKSKYIITYTVNDEKEEDEIVLQLKPINGLLNGFKAVYEPYVTINNIQTNEFDDICEGTVNTKFVIEEVADLYKKNIKKKYRKEKKNFRFIKENFK